MMTYICQLQPNEADEMQHQTCLLSHYCEGFKTDRAQTLKAYWSTCSNTYHFAKVAISNGVEVSVPTPHSYVIKTLQNKLIEGWESWWSNSNTGLRVKSFFPKSSLGINPHSSYVTQILTNHGPFVFYLHRFKLKTTPNYLCGSVGYADHYVFTCPLTKDFHLVCPSQKTKKA
ncbi:uncharacterized protein TNCV_4171931 [Trichonephila clavipes]|nr:uncharacterized protein TNCV_4171931 [Trichonephila clavipes]